MKTSFWLLVISCLFFFAGSVCSQSRTTEGTSKHANTGHPPPAKNPDANQPKSLDTAPIKDVQSIPLQAQRDAPYFDSSALNSGKNGDSESRLVRVTIWLAAVGFVQAVILAVQAVLFFQQKRLMGEHKVSLGQLAIAAGNNATAIQTQAGIMEKQLASMNGQIAAIESQNATMQESVAIARDAAEAGMEKERARLKIIVQDIIPQVSLNVAVCNLENYGVTPAFISDFRVRFLYCLVRDIIPDYRLCRQVLYAESLQANERSAKSFLIQLEPSDYSLTEDDVMKTKKSEAFIHFYGFVKYQDVFKRDRQSTIHVRWTMRWGGTMEGMIMQWWEPVGLPDENADK
jgi:hypothetical protein